MIKNFILTRYRRESFDNKPSKEKTSINMDDLHNVQEALFQQQIKQINLLYPNANIHLLTNDSSFGNNSLFVHLVDVPSNHLLKLNLYSLIDESAMYLDNDILLIERFKKKHLESHGPFNMYRSTPVYNMQFLSTKKLPQCANKHFNAGIIWIKSPSDKLKNDMTEIHEEYFSDRQRIMDAGWWADSDEFPAAVYACLNKFKMNLFDEVCVNRGKTNNIFKHQSVHYTGANLEIKRLCVKEYDLVHPSRVKTFL